MKEADTMPIENPHVFIWFLAVVGMLVVFFYTINNW